MAINGGSRILKREQDSVSALSSFIANAHNELYLLPKRRLTEKNAEAPSPFESATEGH